MMPMVACICDGLHLPGICVHLAAQRTGAKLQRMGWFTAGPHLTASVCIAVERVERVLLYC
jgi:hypothetical protein